ncbi:MAG: hypothetical protein WD599_01530, partial [Balneolaceae bacterium]
GDGGTAREVMKHSTVQHVDMVEIDPTVVEASKNFLPEVGDFDNPKLNVLYQDGITFVKKVKQPYDVLIVDGSDPVGPAGGLFEKEFYRDCFKVLTDQGVLVTQTESPWVSTYHPSIKNVYKALVDPFRNVSVYLTFIPLYPGGMWSMMCASKKDHPLDKKVIERVDANNEKLRDLKYYNPDIHQSCFALPNFVADIIKE